MLFQIFGSPSSTDLDAAVFVDKIPSIKESAELCHAYNRHLAECLNTDKKPNVNLAQLGNGHLLAVYKGTTDELNNALFQTYDFHQQYHPQQITQLLERDVELKMLRCARKILSYFSRTALRPQVKQALRGDFAQRIKVLQKIQLDEYTEFGRKGSLIEFRKACAFQLGQTLGLLEGVELYTKEAVGKQYPDLESFLMRENMADSKGLQPFLGSFIEYSLARIGEMGGLREYDYVVGDNRIS